MIPEKLLQKFAHDKRVPLVSRNSFMHTLALDKEWRIKRKGGSFHKRIPPPSCSTSADVIVYDCGGQEILPGTAMDPSQSDDNTVRRAFNFTERLISFFKECFDRNSIDDCGITLRSSVHYSKIYSNAYWSSDLLQMIYGDGDGYMLLDFTNSPEFIAHEVTHGLTQFTTKLEYENEAGALNESISDVFGSMFVQWFYQQDVTAAHWQIGPDIIGPSAKKLGYLCVRDLAQPGAVHSMTQQPSNFDHYIPGGDPHDNSGIPNHAFYLASMAIGGRSWERMGRIWYATLMEPRSHPSMKFSEFALYTIENANRLYASEPSVAASLSQAWSKVKVSF